MIGARSEDRIGDRLREEWGDLYSLYRGAYSKEWANMSPLEKERAVEAKRAVLAALDPRRQVPPLPEEWTRLLVRWSLAATPFGELQHGTVGVGGWSASAQADYEREARERGRLPCRGDGACGPLGWCAVGVASGVAA